MRKPVEIFNVVPHLGKTGGYKHFSFFYYGRELPACSLSDEKFNAAVSIMEKEKRPLRFYRLHYQTPISYNIRIHDILIGIHVGLPLTSKEKTEYEERYDSYTKTLSLQFSTTIRRKLRI